MCLYTIRQSGLSILSRRHITKRGNRSLLRTLWQMALGIIRHTDKFKAYYEKNAAKARLSNKQLSLLTTNCFVHSLRC
ncbi:transposase [Hydrogenimonas sp.]